MWRQQSSTCFRIPLNDFSFSFADSLWMHKVTHCCGCDKIVLAFFVHCAKIPPVKGRIALPWMQVDGTTNRFIPNVNAAWIVMPARPQSHANNFTHKTVSRSVRMRHLHSDCIPSTCWCDWNVNGIGIRNYWWNVGQIDGWIIGRSVNASQRQWNCKYCIVAWWHALSQKQCMQTFDGGDNGNGNGDAQIECRILVFVVAVNISRMWQLLSFWPSLPFQR